MPIFGRWRRLDALPPVRHRDALPGVYEIADADRRVVYIGQSARDVPNRIRQHLAAGGCVATRGVYWRMQASLVPRADEADLLDRYASAHGDLPPCNEATQRLRDPRSRWAERSGS